MTPATVLADGSYTWRVRTWNAGGYGPWSSPLSFTVSVVGLLAPSTSAWMGWGLNLRVDPILRTF